MTSIAPSSTSHAGVPSLSDREDALAGSEASFRAARKAPCGRDLRRVQHREHLVLAGAKSAHSAFQTFAGAGTQTRVQPERAHRPSRRGRRRGACRSTRMKAKRSSLRCSLCVIDKPWGATRRAEIFRAPPSRNSWREWRRRCILEPQRRTIARFVEVGSFIGRPWQAAAAALILATTSSDAAEGRLPDHTNPAPAYRAEARRSPGVTSTSCTRPPWMTARVVGRPILSALRSRIRSSAPSTAAPSTRRTMSPI